MADNIQFDIKVVQNELEKALKKAGVEGEKTKRIVTDTTKAIEKVDSTNVVKAKDSFISLGKAVKGFIGLSIVNYISAYSLEASKLAGQLDGVRNSFDNLVSSRGKDPVTYFTDLKEASRGLISELDLKKAVNLADSMNVELDAMGKLMQVAQVASQNTGESFEFMFDSIVRGSARQSKLILDNLGIQIGAMADNLSEAEQRQFFFNEVLKNADSIIERSGGLTENYNTQLQRTAVNFEEIKAAIGSKVGDGVAGGLLAISETIKDLVIDTSAMNDNISKSVDNFSDLATRLLSDNIEHDRRLEIMKKLNSEYPDYIKGIDLESGNLETLEKRINAVNRANLQRALLLDEEAKLRDLIKNKVKAKLEAEKLEADLKRGNAGGIFKSEDPFGIQGTRLEELFKEITRKNKDIEDATKEIAELRKAYQVEIDQFFKSPKNSTVTSGSGSLTEEQKKEIEQLSSTIAELELRRLNDIQKLRARKEKEGLDEELELNRLNNELKLQLLEDYSDKYNNLSKEELEQRLREEINLYKQHTDDVIRYEFEQRQQLQKKKQAEKDIQDVVKFGRELATPIDDFVSALINGQDAMGSFGDAFKRMVAGMVTDLVSNWILIQFLNLVSPGSGDVFGSSLGGTSGLILGGNTPQTVGTPALDIGALSNSISNNINGLNVNVSGKLSGSDILLSSRRASRQNLTSAKR